MSDSLERELGGLKVSIDRTTCIGSGNCVNLAPELFELDERQIVTFVSEPAILEEDRLEEACRVCPVDALVLIGKNGSQIVP